MNGLRLKYRKFFFFRYNVIEKVKYLFDEWIAVKKGKKIESEMFIFFVIM